MAVCQKIRRTRKIFCAASFNRTIDILTRDQLAAVDGTADPTIDLPAFATVQAMIKSNKPVEIFIGTNLKQIETHTFTIRFTPAIANINKDHTINIDDKFFRIERIENVDQENRYFILFCTIRGDDTIVGNRA
jgi:head-tail adaptor